MKQVCRLPRAKACAARRNLFFLVPFSETKKVVLSGLKRVRVRVCSVDWRVRVRVCSVGWRVRVCVLSGLAQKRVRVCVLSGLAQEKKNKDLGCAVLLERVWGARSYLSAFPCTHRSIQ